jgi:hypothetical protein
MENTKNYFIILITNFWSDQIYKYNNTNKIKCQ